MRFSVHVHDRHAFITTPRDVARLILLDVCERPVKIRNGFWEFLEFGRGLEPKDCHACGRPEEAYERDNVATLDDLLPWPQKIRLYPSDPNDFGKRVLIQGTDQNGVTVTSTDLATKQTILGEWVFLKLPFSDSLNYFSSITGILKDVTLGPVGMFQVDPNNGVQLPLSSMEPQETTASYRRYLLNGLPHHCCHGPCGKVQVTAQARLEFVPVVSDSDYLFIPCIPALIEECKSIRYSTMDSPQAAQLEQKCHAKAISLLNGQLDLYEGKVNTSVRISLFGSNPLRHQPV